MHAPSPRTVLTRSSLVVLAASFAGCGAESPTAPEPPEPLGDEAEVPSMALIPPIFASIDQAQPLTAGPGAPTLAIGGGSEQKLAQGFTVGAAGNLAGISVPVGCSANGVRVDIQGVAANGEPDGTTLAAGYLFGFLAPDVVAEPPNFVFIRTWPQISVAVGDELAFVLSSPGTCGTLRGPAGDNYAGGDAFFDARPNAAGVWVAFADFAGEQEDLPFQTWVR